MPKRAVVLDFDGTIADSEQVMLEIYDGFAKKAGWPKLTHENYVKLRGGSVKEGMSWAGVRLWQLPKLLRTGRREYQKHQDRIQLFPYMPGVVSDLAKSNHDLYILSSNSKDTVKSILAANGLSKDVTVLKGSPIFKKHKALKKVLKNYDKNQSWMIGDEIRDIEAAKKVGMRSIGVAWGLQSESALRKAKPDIIAEKPGDITDAILGKKDENISKKSRRGI